MSGRPLAPGQRVDIGGGPLAFEVACARPELLEARTACLLLALGADGRAPEVFPPANSLTRELRSGASFEGRHRLALDLSAVPEAVQRLSLLLYTPVGLGFTLKDLGELTARAGDDVLKMELVNRGEAALILFDVYRRGAGWRLAAVGQGFTGGLPAVGQALGVTLDAPTRELDPNPGHPDERRPRRGERGSGSGFAVTPRFVLTNHHVIEDARTVSVSNERATQPAEVVFSDPRNDIALLALDRDVGGIARFRQPDAPLLGEDVVVLGYPLQGLLGSGPQVSAGNVSALCGVGNDTGQLQFTAPIASGNSGGPILDGGGLIIGLVRASLNHEHVRLNGGSGENINFGVKAALVRAFLSAAGVEPATAAPSARSLSRADIARDARRFLHRIDVQC